MIFRAKPPIRRSGRGVEVHLSGDERRLLTVLVADHRQKVAEGGDDPDLRRLFPTAYHDDPEKDAEYQVLARSELTDARLGALATLERTVDAEVLDDEQVVAWMQAINQLRLVLGTRLDIGEDDDEDLDPDAEDGPERILYHYLTMVLSMLVDAAGP